MKKPRVYTIAGETDKGPRLLIFSGVHGMEEASVETARCLVNAYKRYQRYLKGEVVVIPVVNEAAVKARSRLNPEDGENLNGLDYNRNEAQWTVSYQIANWLVNLAKDFDYCLDLHGGSIGEYFNHIIVPRPQLADLAREFGYGYVIHRTALSKGSRSRRGKRLADIIVERYQIPVFILEMGAGYRVNPELVKWGIEGVLRFSSHIGVLPSHTSRLETTPADRFYNSGDEIVVTVPKAGRLRFFKKLGDVCEKGEAVAQIIDEYNSTTSLTAPARTQLIYQRLMAEVGENEIGKETAFRLVPAP